MKQDKKEKRNNILYSVLGFVLGIAMCGIGIYGMILNRIESQEYKNTTDKREVIAVVAVSYTHLTLPTKRIV